MPLLEKVSAIGPIALRKYRQSWGRHGLGAEAMSRDKKHGRHHEKNCRMSRLTNAVFHRTAERRFHRSNGGTKSHCISRSF